MIKPIPRSGRLALPALLCCLPLAGTVAEARPAASATPLELRARPMQAVTGRVTDDKGEGLPGVTVLVKGTSVGTSTGADGSFSLDVPDGGTLIISSVGFVTQEIAVAGRTTIDVRLVTDTQQLNDVVVVGYLTQKREDVTGSVASIGATDVRRAPVATLSEAIQGRLPGVQVTTNGLPGQTPNILIRGAGTLNAGSGPLFIIDGLWITGGLRDFTPQDVENVQVLKDAAALAPYGVSGANGVVIITTRKGRANTSNINFNAYAGPQNIVKRLDLANADQYVALARQAYTNAGLPVPAGVANRNPNIDTDWQDEFFRTGVIQDYNLGFSGGGTSSNYLISGNYFNQTGAVQGPKYERYSLRVNSGFTKGKLRMGENLVLTRANQTRLIGAPFIDILRLSPLIPVLDARAPGGFGSGNANTPNFGSNPIGAQQLRNDTGLNNQLQGNVFAEFDILSSLRYRLNLGTQYRGFRDQIKQRAGRLSPNNETTTSSYSDAQGNETFLLAENTLTFDRSFGKNNVTVVGGYSEQRLDFQFTQANAQGYGNGPDYFWAIDAGSTALPGVGSTFTKTKRSFFGQLTYDFDGRYLVTGAYRRDGSSVFSIDRRYGDFGAASLGWRVSREAFFAPLADKITDFKLRASYGILGSDQLNGGYGGSYLYQSFINPNVNYNFGGVLANGATQTTLGSPTVGWEERRTQNYGLDLGFLENRLTLGADYYISETRNANVNPPIALLTGTSGGDPFQQIGRIENKGLEFLIGYTDNRAKFTYGATANLTTVNNKVLDLGTFGAGRPNLFDNGPGGVTRTEVGYEVGSFYLYQFDGIFQTADNIAGSAQPSARPGDVRYRDTNGDNKITPEDRVHVGRVFPKLQYGLNLTAGYAGLDFAAFFQGVQGNDVYNSSAYWLGRFDDQTNYRADLAPWTPTNPSNTTPRLTLAGTDNSFANSTRFLESGSYVRLKNLQIGYSLPKSLVERTKGLGTVRVYVTAQNLFTLTDYSGFDPETIGGLGGGLLTRGVDESNFPNLRTFTGGIQLGF